jgi:Ca2+-binding EF-hand superfamily protein
MKQLVMLAAVAALGFGAAAAKPGHDPEGGPGGHFDRMDKNGDGKITADEMDASHREMVDAADTNRDGAITREEMRALHERKIAERMGDTNGDGSVSRAEFDAKSKERFDALDTNKDGVISADEAKKGRPGHGGRGDR